MPVSNDNDVFYGDDNIVKGDYMTVRPSTDFPGLMMILVDKIDPDVVVPELVKYNDRYYIVLMKKK